MMTTSPQSLLIDYFTFFRDLKAESRYSFVTTTFYDWIKNVNLVNYGSYYLTFPEKTTSSVFFNGTVSNVFPLSYTLAGAALIAYVSEYIFVGLGAFNIASCMYRPMLLE